MTSPGRTPDYTGDGGGSGAFLLPVFVAATVGIKDDPISSEISFGSGDFRIRRVDTIGPATLTGAWQMSAQVFNDFVTWYEQTLLVGSLAFELTVMNYGPGVVTRTALFIEPYQATTDDGLNYTVTAKLQIADTGNVVVPGGADGPADPTVSSPAPNTRLPYHVYLLDTFSVDEPPVIIAPPVPAYKFPDEGIVTVAGLAPVSVIGYVTQPGSGSASIAGVAPFVYTPINPGGVVVSGAAPTVALSGSLTVRPDVGAIQITTYPTNPVLSGAAAGATFYPSVGATWVSSTALTVPINDVPVYSKRARTIVGVSLLTLGGSGSCVVDIWKTPIGSYPPTIADSICAAAKPTIAAGVAYADTALTGWTTSVSAGDTLMFNLTSCSTFTLVAVSLQFVES